MMDNYEKIRSVGRGAHGTVYLCRDMMTGQKVIIKQIPVESMTVSERQAALGEATVLRMLSHPNIIGYINNFIEDTALCIVMEYAQGGTLAECLEEREGCPFREEEVLWYFSQILLSLHHLHSQKILHRDLKTRNILMDSSRRVCKLSDFGISKMLMSKSKASTLIGTPSYLSPEICLNKPYNTKSDIWALGCVLYELITLRKAFDADSMPAVIMKICNGAFDPLPERCSDELKQLLELLLKTDPLQRPSADDLIAYPLLVKPMLCLMWELGRLPCLGTLPASSAPDVPHIALHSGAFPHRLSTSSSSLCDIQQRHRLLQCHAILVRKHGGATVTHALATPSQTTLRQLCISTNFKLGLTNDGRVVQWDPLALPFECTPSHAALPYTYLRFSMSAVVSQMSCGDDFVAVVSDRGILMTFGTGINGCLGHGNKLDVSQPKLVERLVGFSIVSVCCGARHTLALTADHALYSWGIGDSGRLGLGDMETVFWPEKVILPEGVCPVFLSCGIDGSAFVAADGAVWCTGGNFKNKLGLWNPQDRGCRPTRALVFEKSHFPLADLTAPQPLSLGATHTVMVANSGDVFTCGSNQFGQLSPSELQHSCYPRQLPLANVDRVTHVVAGSWCSIVVSSDARMLIFGGLDQWEPLASVELTISSLLSGLNVANNVLPDLQFVNVLVSSGELMCLIKGFQ